MKPRTSAKLLQRNQLSLYINQVPRAILVRGFFNTFKMAKSKRTRSKSTTAAPIVLGAEKPVAEKVTPIEEVKKQPVVEEPAILETTENVGIGTGGHSADLKIVPEEPVVEEPQITEEKPSEEIVDNEILEVVEKPIEEVIEEEVLGNTPIVVSSEGEGKMISCRVINNHQCVIGKMHYDLSKGSVVSLPVSVATILSNANIVVKR